MANISCNNDDCIFCLEGKCGEEDVELVCESGNYLDYDDFTVHPYKSGMLYCETYIEKT